MLRQISPTLKISTGLALLTISVALCGYIFGLLPDATKADLDARASVAEALAVQLSAAAARNDFVAIQETISSIENRNTEVLSIALRRANGEILIATGDHARSWVEPGNNRSTPTHVQVPLLNGEDTWGRVEIAFRPLSSSDQIAGIPLDLVGFVAFLGLLGFVGYYFVLRRALRELDPSSVIPERVQAAFNTLAEGVMILDEREVVLLANDSIASMINESPKTLFGKKINDLKWRQWSDTGTTDYPWRVAIRDHENVTSVPIGIRTISGDVRSFMVNATCIADGKGVVSGTIVTFDDVTDLERKNEDLNRAIKQLEENEEAINRQNSHLQYLANHDPLSGCLNRRALFAKFETSLECAYSERQPLTCLMVDLDHFKRINDRFGHAVGDEVIAGMAGILKSICREEDFAGRYGGEEFCVVLCGLNQEMSEKVAERIRQAVIVNSKDWIQNGEHVTASIGVAMLPDEPIAVTDIVDRADKALYAAKSAGRDRVVFWDGLSPETKSSTAKQSPAPRSTDHAIGQTPEESTVLDIVLPEVSRNTQTDALPRLRSEDTSDPAALSRSRLIFMDRVSQSIARAEGNQKIVAVLQCSIDSYDRFTEVFGEEASERLVSAVGNALSAVLRRSDTVSLVGGGYRVPTVSRLAPEKFAIEISDLDATDTVTWIIRRVLDSLSRPIELDGEKVYVRCSFGASLYPGDGADADTLIRHASVAERHARESDGNNAYMFYSKEMNEASRRQMMLESGIRDALEHGEFSLHYQPIIDVRTGRLTAAEALLRCRNKDLQRTPIGMLISVAEQTGLMTDVGEWVFKSAIDQLKQWHDQGLDLPKLSVNLSPVQLRDSMAIERLVQIITEIDIPPQKLQLEVTETAIVQDIDAAGHALKRIQQLGVQIALDDFGTGQSSLTYLRRFRPDVLKIDRSFIDEIDTSRADGTLVAAVTAMSHRMGLRVVAEGVETSIQMDCLRILGCDEVQGYLIARPMPATAMSNWLRLFSAKDVTSPSSDDDVNFSPSVDSEKQVA
jgi:diguanylate cyclase (GGDEF)-like protein